MASQRKQINNILVSNLFFHTTVSFEHLNFCFMKTANIPVYGTIAVYIKVRH